MPKTDGGKWKQAIELHEAAVEELVRAAERVPGDVWHTPREEDKWSPAQIVQHLILGYETLTGELRGEAGMALRTAGWQRVLLNLTLRPRLLRGGAFPRGARSPRELRPGEVDEPQSDTIARFRKQAAEFQSAAEVAYRERPDARLTHAYFGSRPLAEAVRFCAVHLRHHQQQLESAITEEGAVP